MATGEEYATYEIVADVRGMGQSYVLVRCGCGALTRCYLWSWAGHGFRRCLGCKKKLRYLDLGR